MSQSDCNSMQVLWAVGQTVELTPGLSVEAYELEVRLTIEADETVGCTDWYVSGVDLYAVADGQNRFAYHPVPNSHPLFSKIAQAAVSNPQLQALCEERWRAWLNDLPDPERRKIVA